jgi:hypothetical protein
MLFLFGRFISMATDYEKEFCRVMEEFSIVPVKWYKSLSSLWLCQIRFCAGKFITALVRCERDGPIIPVQILEKEFFTRIHKAFAIVSVFWFDQVRFGMQWRNLSPVSEAIQQECSWIFAVDTSQKGALLLRMLLRGYLGCYSLHSTSEREVRLSIVRSSRTLPVFDRIVDRTMDKHGKLLSL